MNGEQQIADGARQLEPLIAGLNNIHEGTALLYSAMDGQGSADEDLRVASGQLAAGTQLLKDNLDKMSGIDVYKRQLCTHILQLFEQAIYR